MSFVPALRIGIWNAWLFMSVFIIQMLIIAFLGKGAWERSHVPPEAKKSTFDRYTGGVANTLWIMALGYSLFLPLQTGTFWFFAGLCVFIFGLTILILATVNFIATPPDQVIMKGVYRFSRHPMYLATFFICAGSGIASGSGLFVILSIIMALCFHREAVIEERYCLIRYGKNYQNYMSNTPRWIGIPKKKERERMYY